MTVRVHMRPSELGEQGYHIDYTEAACYRIHKSSGALILTDEDADDADEVGRVPGGRWDGVVILEDSP